MTDSTEDYLYLRKSRDKAEQADPDLLHKHRRELLRLVGRPVPPERIYQEIGSGDTLRARPVCRALLAEISRLPRGRGGNLWTTEVSRLTRGSLSDRARVHEALSRAGIVHCTRSGRYDLNKTSDLLQWEILTTMAQHELGQYKDRVEAARIEMALEGRPQNARVPFGWWWDRNFKCASGRRGRVQTDPARFPITQALCEEALHLSVAALAEKYGLPPWVVWDTLRTPFICGFPAKRHFPHGGERVRRDNGEEWTNASAMAAADRWIWPQQPGDYEPACTREQWDAIQQALDARRIRPTHTLSAEAWARAVVRFAGYEDRPARLSAADGHPTYEVSRSRREGGHSHVYIRRAAVHEAALAALLDLFADPDTIRRGADLYRAERRPAGLADATALTAQVAQLERLVDALLDRELRASAQGDMREVASIVRQREQYKRDLAAAEAGLEALARQCGVDPAVEDLLSLLRDFEAAELAAVWPDLEDSARGQVIAGLIEVIPCRVWRPEGERRWRREVGTVRLRRFFRQDGD